MTAYTITSIESGEAPRGGMGGVEVRRCRDKGHMKEMSHHYVGRSQQSAGNRSSSSLVLKGPVHKSPRVRCQALFFPNDECNPSARYTSVLLRAYRPSSVARSKWHAARIRGHEMGGHLTRKPGILFGGNGIAPISEVLERKVRGHRLFSRHPQIRGSIPTSLRRTAGNAFNGGAAPLRALTGRRVP